MDTHRWTLWRELSARATGLFVLVLNASLNKMIYTYNLAKKLSLLDDKLLRNTSSVYQSLLLYEVGELVYCCTCADNVQVGVKFLDKPHRPSFEKYYNKSARGITADRFFNDL